MKFLVCVLLIVFFQLKLLQAKIKVVASPVVYTNNNGGGIDELEAPSSSAASKLFNAEGHVLAAWWIPFDNIGDLSSIHRIETIPAGNHVNLIVHGVPNQRNGRVRIKIMAEILGNE